MLGQVLGVHNFLRVSQTENHLLLMLFQQPLHSVHYVNFFNIIFFLDYDFKRIQKENNILLRFHNFT